MTILRLCVCLLISATLFMLGGCKKKEAHFVPQDHDVSINNCIAKPKTVDVHEGDRVHWQPVDRDYTVSFSDASEPTANPIKVKHGVPDPGHPIKGHKNCPSGNNGDYYCNYTVTSDEPPSCPNDPGIHIIPGG